MPQTNFNALTLTINAYLRDDERPGEFDARRLEREIQKVKDVSAVEGWKLGAMLGSAMWDKDRVLHDTAVLLPMVKHDTRSLVLIGQCLWNVGLFAEAKKISEQAYELAPNDSRSVAAVIEHSVCLADYERAMSVAQSAITMGVSLDEGIPDLSANLADLAALGVAMSRLKIEAAAALEVMADFHVRCRSVRSSAWSNLEFPGGHYVRVYVFKGTVSQEIELEKALAAKLMDDPDWDPNRLSTEFLPLSYLQ